MKKKPAIKTSIETIQKVIAHQKKKNPSLSSLEIVKNMTIEHCPFIERAETEIWNQTLRKYKRDLQAIENYSLQLNSSFSPPQ